MGGSGAPTAYLKFLFNDDSSFRNFITVFSLVGLVGDTGGLIKQNLWIANCFIHQRMEDKI